MMRRPFLHVVGVIIAMAGAVSCASFAAAQQRISADNLTDEHVQKAAAVLIDALYERKHAQRFWELEKIPANESTRQGGGYTALATLALVHAGQSYQDPRLRDAVDYLANLQMQGTYAITTRASLWGRLPPRFHKNLTDDARLLLEGFSEKNGGWDYIPDPNAKYHDNSIRQFGALALWDAAKRDVKFDRRIWQRIEDAYITSQLPDGGWNYKGEGAATGSMTAAGLATLFITQDLLHTQEAVALNNRSQAKYEKAIETGLQWMDKHFSPTVNPGKDTYYFYYYLYGVERVGLASGYKYFGGRDWFREAAAELISKLLTWDSSSETFSLKKSAQAPSKTDEIAFALMFLSRGRVPVAFNKLQFAGAWNNRPRDAANLTRWIGDNAERELSWQIVNINSDPVSWLDASCLYIASHEPLPWIKRANIDIIQIVREARNAQMALENGEQRNISTSAALDIPELTTIKTYIDAGGLVVALNEGSTRGFAESVEHMGLMMYPHYQWVDAPDSHWAYTAHMPVKGRKPPLRILSNGVRDLIILSPGGDWPAVFQTNNHKRLPEFHTASNVFSYASELNRPRPRLGRAATPSSRATTLQAITIARAIHHGNWNCEPLALHRVASWLAADRSIRLNIQEHSLARIHEVHPAPAAVIVSGTEAVQFTEAQLSAIRTYVHNGGVVLFETAGGGGDFTSAAEAALEAASGGRIEPLIRTRIITGEGIKGAKDLTQVEYRPFALQAFGTRDTAPRLRGITINEQRGPQILFSREDISHALLDRPCWGVSGYSTASARELLANIIQHAASSSRSD